jgi:hypothetical protein
VSVCERDRQAEREREREGGREGERDLQDSSILIEGDNRDSTALDYLRIHDEQVSVVPT